MVAIYGKDVFVDLHVHSHYSDGTFSPDQLIREAVNNNVGIISITDHNRLEGTIEAKKRSKDFGIIIIHGVELDSNLGNKRCHILGYDFDIYNKEFREFVEENRRILERLDEETIDNISKDYNISLSDYKKYDNEISKGGWKLINYLTYIGVARDQDSAIALMKEYKNKPTFPQTEIVVNEIHKAGGVAILAHPGKTFKNSISNISKFMGYIEEVKEKGISGIECFYPLHKYSTEEKLVEFCKQHNLLITVGSDFHGEFGHFAKNKIGCEFKRLSELELWE